MAGLITKFGVTKGTKLYFGNLFTSMGLLKWLSSKEIGGTGTVGSNRSNRVIAKPHPDPKTMEKEERGSSMTYYTEDTEDCVGTAWKDNKSVYVASNVHSIGDGDKHFIRGISIRYGFKMWVQEDEYKNLGWDNLLPEDTRCKIVAFFLDLYELETIVSEESMARRGSLQRS